MAYGDPYREPTFRGVITTWVFMPIWLFVFCLLPIPASCAPIGFFVAILFLASPILGVGDYLHFSKHPKLMLWVAFALIGLHLLILYLMDPTWL